MSFCPLSPLHRALFGGAALLLVSACGTFGGGNDVASDEETPVAPEEERVAVLALQQPLEPDIRFYGQSITLPPAFTNTSWAQPAGEPDHVMHHLTGPEAYARAWVADVGAGGRKKSPLLAPPVIADGQVFTIDSEATVRAFSTDDGDEVWSRSMTPEISAGPRRFWQIGPMGRVDPAEVGFGGGVAFADGRLFVTSGFGFAAALDAATGELLWQTELSGPVRNPPTAVGGQVYAFTIGNEAVALDQATGELLWSYASFEEAARILSSASVAVDSDIAVLPFSSGEVVAVEAGSGNLLWQATVARSSRLNALSELSDIAGSPVIDRGAVFAISHAGQLSAINARSGQVVWEVPVGGTNMPWVGGDAVFVVSTDGQLVAVNREDGGIIWVRQLPAYENEQKQKNPITWAGPIIAGDQLVLASSTGRLLTASIADGSTVGEAELNAGTMVPPVIADGQLYIVNRKGQLEAWR